MSKKLIAFLSAFSLLIGIVVLPATAASSSSSTLIATNIPKSFPVVKQDPSATVVTFWHAMTGDKAVIVTNICNWFNSTEGKKKKIYVKPVFQGNYEDETIKIQASLQAKIVKNLPDIVQLSAQGVFSVKESKYMIYMEDLIKADSTFKVTDKLDKNAMWACSYKGKQLGLPFSNSMIMLHYNADAFKAAGLDPDDPPKTMAEYVEAVKKLLIKGTGKKPSRYGGCLKLNAYQLATLIPRQKGGKTTFQFNNEDGTQGTPTEYSCYKEGTLKATLTSWKSVLDTGSIDYAGGSATTNFEYGKACTFMDSMVNYQMIDIYFKGVKDKTKIFEHRITRIPTVNANDSVGEAIGGSAVYMLNKGDSAKKAASWAFVKFLATVDVSAYWYINSGYYPLNNDALNTAYVQNALKADPNRKPVLTVRSNSKDAYKYHEAWIPSYATYSNCVGDQIALMGGGKQTVDKTAENIAKKAESILKTYAAANSKS